MRGLVRNIVVGILTFEAKMVLRKHKPHVVGITGTVGKTSTKNAVTTVLSSQKEVRSPEKGFNTEIGIPLTVLGLENAWSNPFLWLANIIKGLKIAFGKDSYPETLVLEMGADHPRDIEKIVSWTKPKTAVLTRYAEVPAHSVYFSSAEAVIVEKQNLPWALPEEGMLITNGDDDIMNEQRMPEVKTHLRYGFLDHNDVRASDYTIEYKNGAPTGISFRVHVHGDSQRVTLPDVLGKQHVYPVIAALAVGYAHGISLKDGVSAIQQHHKPPIGRMQIIWGIKNSTLIDDTYNSSPVALHEALNTLENIATTKGKRIAILGDMRELGDYSEEEHRSMGRHAAKAADILVTVGKEAKVAAESARKARMGKDAVFTFLDSGSAGRNLREIVEEGDVVLIKGSQAVRMEKATEQLMIDPRNKKRLLVRQEKAWEYR